MSDPGERPSDPKFRLQLREAEAAGASFLVFRDEAGAPRIVLLGRERSPLVVGRSATSDVPISWDDRVSRTHAQITPVGHQWSIEDEGLSRNGTFVNEVRVTGRRRLRAGDVIRVGHTVIAFHAPEGGASAATIPEAGLAPQTTPSAGQLKVLTVLCRPCLAPGGPHPPSSNEQIAAELHLTVDAVKAHLRQLFRRYEIEELPQIQKRTALVRIALASGVLRRPT